MITQNMKYLATVGVLALTLHQAQAISLDFSSLGGTVATRSQLEFNGQSSSTLDDIFRFTKSASGATAGFSFKITNSDGFGDSVDDLGIIQTSAVDSSSATFTIGNVTINGPIQTAFVSGSGYLKIKDHNGVYLTGDLTWETIQTQGTAGNANLLGSVNLKNIIYFGVEQDLIALANDVNGWASATFQFGFNPGKTLNQLKAEGAVNTTSFTGDFTAQQVPDGGAMIGMLGLGFLALGAARRKMGQ